jgi:protein-disulfide isomerase
MNEKLTRNEQREAAREKAKALREQHKKGEKRKRLVIQLSVVIGTLAIVGVVVGALIVGANAPKANAMTPVNFTYDDGIKLGANGQPFTATSTPTPTPAATPGAKAPINIKMYIDFQCPICQGFELANSDQVKSWLTSGYATLELHPLSFLDGQATPNEYSSRADNAAICVAENSPAQFFDYVHMLFQKQPQENTAGPSNDELFATAKSVGITNEDKIKSCIDSKSYGDWIKKSTSKVLSSKYVVPGSTVQVKGTPTIVVNGQSYTWETFSDLTNPARFAQWVQKAAGN